MDDFRKEVIKELEKKLGDDYKIFPQDRTKNNGFTAHGVCIRKKSENIGAVAYIDEALLMYAAGATSFERIADGLIQQCCHGGIHPDAVKNIEDFGMMKDRLRLRLINYAANSAEMENIPHRRFLDLAVTYCLDVDIENGNAALIVSNVLLKIWNATEEDLYRTGMENLHMQDKCLATDLFSIVRELAEDEEAARAVLDKIEKMGGKKAEIYAVSNQKQHYGAACMLDHSFLQQMADSKGCDLIIYPGSINVLVIEPVKDGNVDRINTEDVWEVNRNSVPKEEWLSNSIYRYDRAKQEVCIYREGAPF